MSSLPTTCFPELICDCWSNNYKLSIVYPVSRETEFFRAVATRDLVRVRVAAIVISEGRVLVQKPVDDPHACFAFIGGEYEVGDTLESRLRKEFEEETTARVKRAEYRFVVENRFQIEGRRIHGLEHYFEVELDTSEVGSTELHLSQHWLPIDTLGDYDLRPQVVRDVLAANRFRDVRHLLAPSCYENA